MGVGEDHRQHRAQYDHPHDQLLRMLRIANLVMKRNLVKNLLRGSAAIAVIQILFWVHDARFVSYRSGWSM